MGRNILYYTSKGLITKYSWTERVARIYYHIYYTFGLVQMSENLNWVSNTPTELERYMEKYLPDVREKFSFPNLDDMLVQYR